MPKMNLGLGGGELQEEAGVDINVKFPYKVDCC